MIKKIITNRNLRGKVYHNLKDFIISNKVPPGSKINEDELARNLGVSKTPVREALSKLAHDGIVEIVPNRGAYKVRLSKEDLQEIMVIMETLEGLCVRLAVANIDETIIKRLKSILDNFGEKDLENDFSWYSDALIKFYTVIYNASKNKKLIVLFRVCTI